MGNRHQSSNQEESESSVEARQVDHHPGQGRPYQAPLLRKLGSAESLLEVLGPAQANYGAPL